MPLEPAEDVSYIFLIHTLLERGKEPNRGMLGQYLRLLDRGEVEMFPEHGQLTSDRVRLTLFLLSNKVHNLVNIHQMFFLLLL